jgi:hypothetical protein
LAGLSKRDLDGDPGNGYEGLYDDVLDITWLADANLTDSNLFGLPLSTPLGLHPSDTSGVNGTIQDLLISTGMNWPGALHWIDAMNAASYLGETQWRLPAPDITCAISSFTCDSSELGHMFYNNLSGTGGSDVTSTGDPAVLALISNLQSSVYFSNTTWSDSSAQVWSTNYFNGLEFVPLKSSDTYYAWPVLDGDHGTAPTSSVPVLAPVWGPLAMATLMGGLAWRRLRG